MKKFLLLVSAMIITGCATSPTNRSGASDTSTNRSAAPPIVAGISEAEVIANEKSIWEGIKARDAGTVSNLLASDFVEVGGDGAYDRTRILQSMKDLDFSAIDFVDWKMIPADRDAVIVVYSVKVKGKFKGVEFPPNPLRAASAWVNRDGKWQSIYYQETLAESSPAPNLSPTPTGASSPAATAGVTPPEDPIEREKVVWDALKRKDYDAFGLFLDDGLTNVASDGVYDKPATLQNIRMFDASKVELSDFKTVKLNDNVTLVTYLARIPGMTPELHRASTIWVKREGQWRALFHQDTPAIKT